MVLTTSDQSDFLRAGILRLPGAVGKKQVARVKRGVLAELERLKLKANGKVVAPKIQALPIFQQTTRLGQMVRVGAELEGLLPDELLQTMCAWAGTTLNHSALQPQLLLSLPHKIAWSLNGLNGLNWHLDLAVQKKDQIAGIQAFVLIDDLQPHGGATLAIAGSHRLPYRKEGQISNAINTLREHSALGELFKGRVTQAERLFEAQSIDGIEVHLIEMHGKAGDVYLMDMRVLHSPSVNSTGNIRMMATYRVQQKV